MDLSVRHSPTYPMARNIEIKGRIESVQALAPRVAKIANDGPTEIFQDDTFSQCETGRLKLRAFSESHGKLIFFYRRPNQAGPKESFYVRSQTAEPASLREAGVGWMLGAILKSEALRAPGVRPAPAGPATKGQYQAASAASMSAVMLAGVSVGA
jgi:hypothetical protein